MKLAPRNWLILLGCLALLGVGIGLMMGERETDQKTAEVSTRPRVKFVQAARKPHEEIDTRALAPSAAELTPEQTKSLEALRKEVPGSQMDIDPITRSPSLIQATGRFLTPANPSLKPQAIVGAFIDQRPLLFGHRSDLLSKARVTREDVSKNTGMTTLVLNQEVNDIPLFKTILKANITKNGELITLSDHFVPAPKPNLAAPKITAAQAIAFAAKSVDDVIPSTRITPTFDAQGVEQRQQFTAPGLTDTTAQLTYLPMNEKDVRLSWDVTTFSLANKQMFRTVVDADTGSLLYRTSLTNDISNASFRVFADATTKTPLDSPTPMSPGLSAPATTQPAEAARTLITLQALDTTASPNGWIDDGNQETQGNNVDAHTDTDSNNAADLPRPNGGASRVFDFGLDLTQSPTSYRDAAVTQLFYLNNWIHDRYYQLGFTETAGNFQTNNFGRGGVGNDAVQADAQDGSGTNNANFSTPTDGSPGRMQMFVWSGPTPDRDGAVDAEIVAHEYTHGLSNRLVGGGAGITAYQSKGLGEGWSDFYALALLSAASDDPNGVYASGAYAAQFLTPGLDTNYYFGVRRYPYCTDMTKNPLTFRDISITQALPHADVPLSPVFSTSNANPSEAHALGEVWCMMLWEVRANLIAKYGWAGNERMLQLVTDSLKICPANPTFIQGRDALIQADLVATGGVDAAEIWAGFAKRGMGYGASGSSNAVTTPVVEIFDLPDQFTVTPSTIFAPSVTRLTGPITSGTQTYTLSNTSTASIAWTATKSQPWITLSASSGTLAAYTSTTVTATINTNAISLSAGSFSDSITFTRSDTGVIRRREVAMTVTSPLTRVFSQTLDVDPQWSRTGEWGFGTPTGAPVQAGARDPTSGYTGANVFGIALGGGYSTTPGAPQYLTTNAINTTGMSNVRLRFKRWINAQGSPYTNENIQVSSDGLTWNGFTVSYGSLPDGARDTAWTNYEVTFGALADNKPNVYFRWSHQVNSYSPRQSYCGWNIDDIELYSSTDTPTLTATPQSLSTPLNTPLSITLAGVGGSNFTVTGAPANGVLSGTAPNLIYTPNNDFIGADSLTFTVSNGSNTSTPSVVTVTSVPVPPEIAVEQPEGIDLTSGASSIDFGDVHAGAQATVTLKIRNVAGGPLNLGGPTIDGANPSDFSLTSPSTTRLLNGDFVFFRVTFAPSLVNVKNAVLHVPSNDLDETSFDIALTGRGIVLGNGLSLVKDINALPAGVSSGYLNGTEGPMTVHGGLAFYSATTLDNGLQLWRTDGTSVGTFPLKSISTGAGAMSDNFVSFNGALYFAGIGSGGTELWKTDGTVVGTVLIKDIYPGSNSSFPARFCVVGSTLFFTAIDGTSGTELWKTDGTAAGTVLVKDVNAGSLSSSPFSLTNFNGTLFFNATDATNGNELWKSDGTTAGTILIKDCWPGTSGSSPSSMVASSTRLFFTANDGTNGTELWSSDGTTAGTAMVKDVNPGASNGIAFTPVLLGSTVIFTGIDSNGLELWASDGTAAGTTMIMDIAPGSSNSTPTNFTVFNGYVYFTTNDLSHGTELWRTNGTALGTTLVKDIAVGSSSSFPRALRVIAGSLIFSAAEDGSSNFELWKSDGTEAGTVRIKDINPGSAGSNPLYFTALGSTTLFSANDGINGVELWRTDGTEAGTVMIIDSQAGTSSSSPTTLRNFNGTLVFSADDGSNGRELWQCAGSPASTSMIRDFGSGTTGLTPTNMTVLGNRIYLTGNDNSNAGTELWKSDGTSAGTVLVKDIFSGFNSSLPSQLTAVGTRLFFSATGSTTQGAELWVTDGSTAGTTLVKDINPTTGSGSSISNGVDLNGNFVFSATDGTNGVELWKSDGTAAGTAMLVDINPGSGSSNPSNLRAINGVLYFSATTSAAGTELWKSDGTSVGTLIVSDINSGSGSSSPANFVGMGGFIYFTATTSANGSELWRTNGTAAGTTLVKDIYSGSSSSSPGELVVIGSTLYFSAADSTSGRELWKSDGSAAGTVLVSDAVPGSVGLSPTLLVNANGMLCFTGTTAAAGSELWKSDGTAAGTSMISDLIPGASSSSPSQLTAVGTRLYFTARMPGLVAPELMMFEAGSVADISVEQPLATVLTSGSATVDWGSFDVGSGSSVTKVFTIRNTGEQTLMLTNTIIDGSGASSFSTSPSLAGVTITGGASTTCAVSFNPLTLGAKTATLRISSNDPDESPFIIQLTGAGVAAPELSIEQADGSSLTNGISTLAVGHAQVDGSDSFYVIVRNVGSGPLDVFGVGIDGDNSSDFTADINAASIAPGASEPLIINFSPTALGSRRATLHVYTDDADEPSFDIVLSAIGSAVFGPLSLVADINSQGASPSIGNAATLGSNFIFAATTPEYGAELWRTDGTVNGTVLIKDIASGLAGSSPANFRVIGTTLFFTASNSTNGIELWKTDGSTGGTVMVKDISSGLGSSSPGQLTNVNGTLFFIATDTTTGQELWKSDGTTAGTVQVKDILTGTSSSNPTLLTAKGSTLMFVANDGTNGPELWTSDGTTAGTVMVKNILTTANLGSSISNMAVVNGVLFFNANDGNTGNELWRSDGTTTGTVQVLDAESGSTSSSPQNFVVSGTQLFYRSTTITFGSELWRSDGTAGGTFMVKDIYSGSVSSLASSMAGISDGSGGLYFTADDGVHGLELWRSDGTASGTAMVADINSSSMTNLTVINGTLYFSALTATGSELWKSNGTESGTVRVADINPGAGNATPSLITALGSSLIFTASNGADGLELWLTDGSSAGTHLMTDLVKGSASSSPTLLRVLNNTLLFVASDGINGSELWSTNARVTGLVKDINPGLGTALITSPVVMETQSGDTSPPVRKLYFSANYLGSAAQLYSSDGTTAGTQLIKSIVGSSGSTTQIVPMNGKLYFSANDSTNGSELWTSDTTASGTMLLKDINAGTSSSSPALLTVVGNKIFFAATTAATGSELWCSDGSTSGTILVKDINPGTTGSSLAQLINVNGKLYFVANDGVNGIELWTSDGTTAGTVMVKDISAGSASSSPFGLVNFNGTLCFSANNATYGTELWKSDGTSAGTVLVKDILTGTTGAGPGNLTVVGSALFFTAFDPSYSTELWKTDGTAAGTVMVKDIFPGTSTSVPSNLSNMNGTLYFSAAGSSTQGAELWKSDGTSAGTVLVADLRPASGLSSSPSNFTMLNGRIFFTATGPDSGTELWSLDTAPRISVEQPITVELENGNATVDFGTLAEGSTTRTFTVKNVGFVPLNIQATNIDGPDRSEFTPSAVPSVIAPGDSNTFNVTFAPQTPGTSAAGLHVFTDDPEATPFDINLTGQRLTSLEGWRLTNFGNQQGLGNAADDADPDRDGTANLLEFAFGTSPASPTGGPLQMYGSAITANGQPIATDTAYGMCAIYLRRKDAATLGMTYTLEFSADLSTWEASAATPSISAQDSTFEAACVPFPATVGGQPARFFRVRVATSSAP